MRYKRLLFIKNFAQPHWFNEAENDSILELYKRTQCAYKKKREDSGW